MIVIFATSLLGMNFLMALILGGFLAARLLFPDDRRVTIAVVVAAVIWAIILPFMHDEGGSFMNIATLILAYSVMALGLNIIVGYAGLLDLGYVAFFALGALTAGGSCPTSTPMPARAERAFTSSWPIRLRTCSASISIS